MRRGNRSLTAPLSSSSLPIDDFDEDLQRDVQASQQRVRLVLVVGMAMSVVLALVGWWLGSIGSTQIAFPVSILLLGVVATLLTTNSLRANAEARREASEQAAEMMNSIRARERELIQSNRELERFATVAAHDLQEPLRTVLTFVDLLDRRYGAELDKQGREYLVRVSGAAARMRNLIEDLLVYARMGQVERTYEPVDLREIVDEAIDDLDQLIRDAHARIDIAPLPTVTGNRPGLIQLITNLVANACKYRMGNPHIRISAEREGSEWIIAVADNGKGIDPLYHERIFELFRRLEPRNRGGGTGLGLAICKRVVDLHGGRLWVRSALGKGSTFFFTLPAHVNDRLPTPGAKARTRGRDGDDGGDR